MKKQIILSLLFLFNAITIHASWTFAIYMESSHNLQDTAIRNLNQMALGASENVRIFVLLHAYDADGWLYEIENKTIKVIEKVTLDKNIENRIFHVIEHAVTNAPADHYGLCLWNHGYGVLTPQYNATIHEWDVLQDGDIPNVCAIERFANSKHDNHRGMLTDENCNICLDNTQMINVFDRIHHELLDGKKIDICGLDMCKGAMVEHAYQLHHYIDYLIGSQECELKDGWPYKGIFEIFKTQPDITAEKLSQHIISTFEQYYITHATEGTYTQSAMNVSMVHELKKNIDLVANVLDEGIHHHPKILIKPIQKARTACTQLCNSPMYVDIYEFYNNLLSLLTCKEHHIDECATTHQLQKFLAEGCEIIEKMVIANCTGPAVSDLHGISIYFPQQIIDASYFTTPFSEKSAWLSFIENYISVTRNV